jgi:hypothetical protein
MVRVAQQSRVEPGRREQDELPTLPHWTKSLRDSLELTKSVMLRGIR